jgi:DNA-binding GntR family transcriptional regulator
MADALQTQSLVDALRDAIQRSILQGEYPAGSQLTEQSVAERYSVARPTAKAAMEQLVRIGMLRRSRHKTTHVPLLGVGDIRDLYFSRGIVERAVVTALAASGKETTEASRAVSRLTVGGDVSDIVGADIEFHRALVRSLDSPRVTRLHDAIIGEAHLCMAQVQVLHLLRPDEIANEHRGIIEAIEAKDPAKASELLDRHLTRACDQLVGFLEEHQRTAE